MPVKKFILVQTFIKFKALQILPINTWTSLHFQDTRSSHQETFYKRAVMHLWLKPLKIIYLQTSVHLMQPSLLQQRQSISQVSAWCFPHWLHPMFPTQFWRLELAFFPHFIRNVATLKAVSLILFFWLKLIWL